MPCSPDGIKLRGLFSGLESRTHLASGSFITLLSGGPPHCLAWDSKHKPQAHGKKAINIYIVWLCWCHETQCQAGGSCSRDQILSLYCEDADSRDTQHTSHRSFLLSSHCLLRFGQIESRDLSSFQGKLGKDTLTQSYRDQNFTSVHWSSNQCPQEMLRALRRSS